MEDILSIAGIARVGGRSAGEIAERFLARAANRSGLPDEARLVLERYLAMAGDPDRPAQRSRALVADAGLDLGAALDALSRSAPASWRRAASMSALHVLGRPSRAISTTTPASSSRCRTRAAADGKPVVGGGRYDGLLAAPRRHDPDPGGRLLVLARPASWEGTSDDRFPSDPGRPLEGAPAGERRRVLCPRRPRLLAIPRRARLSRHARGRAGRRGGVPVGLRDRQPAAPPGRPISASPARTWSASRSPMRTRRSKC